MSLNLAVISREGAKRYGDRAALVAGNTTLSYRQLDDQAQRLAGALRRLVSRGQHVALMMPNVPAFAVAYFACHYAGVAVVPLNVMLKAEEIAYHLEDSDAVALICHESLLGDALTGFEGVAGCRHLIVADEGAQLLPGAELQAGAELPSGVARMSALLDSGERISELPDTNPDDTAVLLYTSGTTGRAKGAELNQVWMNLLDNALDAIGETGNIEIIARKESEGVVVRIVDDGHGISESSISRVFDPFFTTKPPGKGIGLGLETARRIVRRHHGEISVQSQPGKTEFLVSLLATRAGQSSTANENDRGGADQSRG